MKYFFTHFIGKRIIKTGLAAFITAWICLWFHFPALFAVITAIVTIEPTATDSIRKGIIRFPAAAIGAGFAMGFELWLGETALCYALAATLTILACHKLRLDTGITVATLTALAMIPETHGHYIDSYFVRLLTTLIGITVSTLINFFILRPKFYPRISENIPRLYTEVGKRLKFLTEQIETRKKLPLVKDQKLSKDLEMTFRLVHFQREEWKYHRRTIHDIRQFHLIEKKLHNLQKAAYHLGNLQYLNVRNIKFPENKSRVIGRAGTIIADAFQDPNHRIPSSQKEWLLQLDELFHCLENDNEKPRRHFSAKMVVTYELLSLLDVLEELQNIS